MADTEEKRMLEEMARLAERINRHKQREKQKQMIEEKRLLRELALVSGLVNKRKRGEEPTPAPPLSLAREKRGASNKRRKTEKKQEQCVYFAKFGECKKGSQCPYKHDPKKVAVCTKFLKGKCICTNPNCPYTHVKVNAQAALCPDFLRGYCPRGLTCKLKHVKKPKSNSAKSDSSLVENLNEATPTEASPSNSLISTPLSSIIPSFDDIEDEEEI